LFNNQLEYLFSQNLTGYLFCKFIFVKLPERSVKACSNPIQVVQNGFIKIPGRNERRVTYHAMSFVDRRGGSTGTGKELANYDFEKLSSAIEDKRVFTSVTTLKRIWGKVRYDHSPTLTTLNTLPGFWIMMMAVL